MPCSGSAVRLPEGQAGRLADPGHQMELHQVPGGPTGQCDQAVRLSHCHAYTGMLHALREALGGSGPEFLTSVLSSSLLECLCHIIMHEVQYVSGFLWCTHAADAASWVLIDLA
jgi:hypothetical protein